MRWNPIYNALAASAYVVAVVLLMQLITSLRSNTPDTIIDPIGALSLLVFSVAVMGFIFFYQPAVLLVEKKATDAISYFLKTLATFGIVTIILVAVLAFAGLA